MKKTLAVLCLLALLCGVLAACGTPKPGALLAGKWNASAGTIEFQAFEFTPDEENPNKGKADIGRSGGLLGNLLNGTYEVIPAKDKDAQDMLKITYSILMVSTTRSYFFTVDENALTLREENSGFTTNYVREGAAVEATTV